MFFENFQDVCMGNYGLDPCWYYTSLSLSWDALLRTRYGEANNPYMGDEYDPEKPTKYITYLDANNLYGWAMCNPLPTGGFKWMEEKELDNWRDIPCTVEVDLVYSKELHDAHNEYPFAAERLVVGKVEKLIPNLSDKTKYVVNHRTLKCCERHGIKVTKVHREIKYQERPWMKKYINLNTNLRAAAKTVFEKDFFKLMNNGIFGKTMENVRNRVNIRLVTSKHIANKLAIKPNFDKSTIFCENLIAVHMKKTQLKLDKPIYLGASILDNSKTLMYDFHYDYVKKNYGPKSKLLFTDTDSLCYEIETENFLQGYFRRRGETF